MASDQVLDSYLTWGEDAKVIESAPQQYHPGEIGSVCGIRLITSSYTAEKFNKEIGTKLYLIEFEDGKAIEIPESFLIKIDG
jgi:hypothetical protein